MEVLAASQQEGQGFSEEVEGLFWEIHVREGGSVKG